MDRFLSWMIRLLIWVVRRYVRPFLFFHWLCEELSGLGRWRRAQHRRMAEERPPLEDEEYLAELGVPADAAPAYLAVREAMAESCGLPATAIRPEDEVDVLGRLMWMGLDLLDITFRLERQFGVKLSCGDFRRDLCERWKGKDPRFADLADMFAEAVARGEPDRG